VQRSTAARREGAAAAAGQRRGKGEKQKRSCEAKNAPCARNTV